MAERSPEQQIREAVSELCELALVPNIREELRREILAALDRLVAERDEALQRGAALRDALLGVGSAYGCFAGCTAGVMHLYTATPAAFSDHSVACRQAHAALAAAAGRTPGEETWDCGCPFGGPHDENCALAEAGRAE